MNSLIALTNLEPRFEYSLRNIAAPTPNGSAIISDIRISISVFTIAGARVGSPFEVSPNQEVQRQRNLSLFVGYKRVYDNEHN